MSVYLNYRDQNSCVDVKDVINGSNISYKKYNNKYVVRVEPHRAMMERDYFIKLIEQAEQQRDIDVQYSRC